MPDRGRPCARTRKLLRAQHTHHQDATSNLLMASATILAHAARALKPIDGSEGSTDSGTDPDMPSLIYHKMSRSRSNTFERRPSVEALDAQRKFRNQVRRRRKSAGCCEQGTGRLSVSYQIAVSARPR